MRGERVVLRPLAPADRARMQAMLAQTEVADRWLGQPDAGRSGRRAVRACERGRDGTWHDGLLLDLLASDLD